MVANARHICKTMIISQETSSTADLYEGVWIRCCTNSHQLGRSLTLWLSIIGPGDPKLFLIKISILFYINIYVEAFHRAEKKSGPSLFCAPALYLLTMCFPYLWQNLTLKVILGIIGTCSLPEFLIRLVSQRHQGPTSIHYRTQTFGMVNVTNLEIKYGCETNFIQKKTHVG